MDITIITLAIVGIYFLFKFRIMDIGNQAGITYSAVVEKRMQEVDLETEINHKKQMIKLLSKTKELNAPKEANYAAIKAMLNPHLDD